MYAIPTELIKPKLAFLEWLTCYAKIYITAIVVESRSLGISEVFHRVKILMINFRFGELSNVNFLNSLSKFFLGKRSLCWSSEQLFLFHIQKPSQEEKRSAMWRNPELTDKFQRNWNIHEKTNSEFFEQIR